MKSVIINFALLSLVSAKTIPTNPKILEKFFGELRAASQNGSSFRSDPITASNMAQKLPDYGCWCKQVYTNNGHKGRPVDEIDEICRQWAKCRKCEEIQSCTGELDVNYTPTLAFDATTFTLVTQCLGMNECTTNRCECDLFHVAKISEIVQTGVVTDENSNLGVSDCVHDGGVASSSQVQHACCGVAPTWVIYDQGQKSCTNGQLN